MARQHRRPMEAEVIMWLLFFALLVPAGLVGWAIGHSSRSATTTLGTTPAGHMGSPNLSVSQIGNATAGRMLFVSKGCADCHSYAGKGGSDAPPLDMMRGHLSATEIADMSGQIWNHLPQMLHHFKEEGLRVPTFPAGQMADLIAYLHSGQGGPPPVKMHMRMRMGGGSG
jgi:mono/diheme cytochrome c family protein